MLPRLVQLCVLTLLCLAASETAQAEPCRSESFKGASYIVCSFDPTKDDLRIYWRGDDGKPYRTFPALAADLERKGKSLRFAMNGGMYQDDLRPVGLYIENGRELTPANTATLTGAASQIPNFYKKPNGVFYIGDGKAGVIETERFLADRPKANFATQSGPMLVIDGAIHPAFIVNSTDRKPRNGVGVSSPTEVHFGHYQRMGELLRVRPFFPRRARLQERPFSRRRRGTWTLCAGAWPQRPARPWRLWAHHRGGGVGRPSGTDLAASQELASRISIEGPAWVGKGGRGAP